MKRERVLDELEQAAQALELKVTYERLSPEACPGGLCRVNGEYRVLIDRNTPMLERINVLVGAVARFSTEHIFLSPEVRGLVERRAGEGPEVIAATEATGGTEETGSLPGAGDGRAT